MAFCFGGGVGKKTEVKKTCLSAYKAMRFFGIRWVAGQSPYDLAVKVTSDAVGLPIEGSAKAFFKKNNQKINEYFNQNKHLNRQLASRKENKQNDPIKRGSPYKSVRIDPNSNDFLLSYDWRKLRMEAIKRDGAKCLCCGASPATGAVLNVDHIKPRRLFPELALDLKNLQTLCNACNHGKGNWDQTDWRRNANTN